MIARAKKAIDSLKKNRKAPTKENNKTNVEKVASEEYFIEIGANPYLSSKDSIIVSEGSENSPTKVKDNLSELARKKSKGENGDVLGESENKIPFTIICKNPVYEFSCYILLFNKMKTDVRRYKVIFTIQPKPLKAIL